MKNVECIKNIKQASFYITNGVKIKDIKVIWSDEYKKSIVCCLFEKTEKYLKFIPRRGSHSSGLH